MQGGAAIKAATRVPEDFTTLGLPRPVEVVSDMHTLWVTFDSLD